MDTPPMTCRAQAKAILILLPLIGVTSIFGFLVFNEATAYAFGVLSCIFNGLQVGMIQS
jgi:hypothetical protein